MGLESPKFAVKGGPKVLAPLNRLTIIFIRTALTLLTIVFIIMRAALTPVQSIARWPFCLRGSEKA